MKFTPSPLLPEIVVIEPDVFKDDRGFFMECYHLEKFEKAGIGARFVQDNRSRSRKGTLRGLHYQIRRAQGKLIWVPHGEVFDVAVDIRKGSPTFGKWMSVTLSEENKKGLYIPPDFAHGFFVLSEKAEVFYKCTDFYSREHERCIRWNDPDLSIPWPEDEPVLSPKDAAAPLLRDAELPQG
ncbi:MAG: dTDP-4-dehydrorhamnose 3,5-epimerase [Desulfobacteraceae bacterium]|nr:MAG: dTDP-4-dehydrorhamnose 3,5-epimerase [Desulfobacteraceae bacterium]